MTEIEISHEYVTVLASSIVLVIIIYAITKKYTRHRVMLFGNFEVLEKVMGSEIKLSGIFPVILRILALVLIVAAISDPQLVEQEQIMTTDFILALDTSSSMLTPDYSPNRLEATKDAALRWINLIGGAKVGIVTFAGKPYVRLNPTAEREKIVDVIKQISFDEPGGTAIGEALISSAALLSGSEGNRVIVLITDGRNNVGVSINDSLDSLRTNEVQVFAVGIGTRSESEIVVPPELSGLNATASEFPNLDEDSLVNLANQTSGKYIRIDNIATLNEFLAQSVGVEKVSTSPARYLLFAGLGLLLIEWAFEITRYRPIP